MGSSGAARGRNPRPLSEEQMTFHNTGMITSRKDLAVESFTASSVNNCDRSFVGAGGLRNGRTY